MSIAWLRQKVYNSGGEEKEGKNKRRVGCSLCVSGVIGPSRAGDGTIVGCHWCVVGGDTAPVVQRAYPTTGEGHDHWRSIIHYSR